MFDSTKMSKQGSIVLPLIHFRNCCFLADKTQPVAVPCRYRSNRLTAHLYHSNGKIQAVGLYQNELKEQLWKYYDNREKLIREENYRNGKLEGQTSLYYPDGNVLEKSIYVADKKEMM